jgi:hypothetical protein
LKHKQWWRDKGPVEAVRTYNIRNGYLEKVKKQEPPYGSILRRVIIGRQKTSINTLANKVLYGDYYGELHIATQYEWRDGRGFFDTTTQHIQKLQAPERSVMHKSLQRWNRYMEWQPDLKRLWQETWIPWRSACENTFLWQMLYWVPATQQWRFPKLLRTDDQTHCTRCRRNQVEDILHCLWSCPRSGKVWNWVNGLLQATSGARDEAVELQFYHIFLAEQMDEGNQIPDRMWKTLRAISCWILWTSRCNHYMAGEKSTSTSDIGRIWARLNRYMQKNWKEKLTKVHRGQLTLTEAIDDMKADYGPNEQVWLIQGCRLLFAPLPPRLQ